MEDHLLTTVEAAEWLRVTRRYLEKLRHTGEGPKYMRLSRRVVRYAVSDLKAWAETHAA